MFDSSKCQYPICEAVLTLVINRKCKNIIFNVDNETDYFLMEDVKMARKRVYTGLYSRHHRRNSMAQHSQPTTVKNFSHFANMVSQYAGTAYNMMTGNYLALATVVAVVLLSFLIPDISQKIHATNELKNMKKVLNLMTKEVNRAEVACLTAADEVCYLQCSMHDHATETPRNVQDLSVCTSRCMRSTVSEPVQVDKQLNLLQRLFNQPGNTSHKEVAIMSYVYTDSFDAEKTMTINCSTLPK